ncbi:osiris 11 [Glossina fuscipes fuscipes]
MGHNRKLLLFKFILLIVTPTVLSFESGTRLNGRSFSSDNSLTRTVHRIVSHCLDRNNVVWCFKLQGARLLGRALKFQNINIVDGVSLVKKVDNETRNGRASANDINLTNRDLENLSMKSLDSLLLERFCSFLRSRQLQVNMPRLLAFGKRNGQELLQSVMDFVSPNVDSEKRINDTGEGRKKKGDDKKYLGPFIAAVLLKTAILKMAYHSIAIVAGKALIVGKIALIISAIIGLKKLVSSDGGEKTTYEIVKHPQVSQSHTYSSSHTGEYEGGHESGSYHRSMDDEMAMQDKAYNAWVPTHST